MLDKLNNIGKSGLNIFGYERLSGLARNADPTPSFRCVASDNQKKFCEVEWANNGLPKQGKVKAEDFTVGVCSCKYFIYDKIATKFDPSLFSTEHVQY